MIVTNAICFCKMIRPHVDTEHILVKIETKFTFFQTFSRGELMLIFKRRVNVNKIGSVTEKSITYYRIYCQNNNRLNN